MRYLIFAALILTTSAAFASTPVVRMVEAAPSVQLEVLDWGGTGPDVVLLAGQGHTAHVYDAFAPRLAEHARVLAVTRRGYGASTHANGGYDLHTLARDLVAVCDSLGLARPVLAGHALAGSEMAFFAAVAPGRARAMIFIDAAYDQSLMPEINDMAPAPPPARPSADDLANPDAVREWLRRTRGALLPASEVAALFVFTADGRVKDRNASNLADGLILDALETPPWARIDAPVLALFTKPSLAVHYPDRTGMDAAALKAAEARIRLLRQISSVSIATFEKACPQSRTKVLDGRSRYPFLTEPTTTLVAIRDFLSGLQQ